MGQVRIGIGSVEELEALVRMLLGGTRRWSRTRLGELIDRLKRIDVMVAGWGTLGDALGELRERTAVARQRWTLAEIARRADRSREHLSRLFNRAVARVTVATMVLWGLAVGMLLWVSVPETVAARLGPVTATAIPEEVPVGGSEDDAVTEVGLATGQVTAEFPEHGAVASTRRVAESEEATLGESIAKVASGQVTVREQLDGAAGHVTAERQPVVPGERRLDEVAEATGVDCDSETRARGEAASGEVTERSPGQITDAASGQITARAAARGDVTADLTRAPTEKIDARRLQSASRAIHGCQAMDRRVVWLDEGRRVVGEAIVSADVAASLVHARPDGAEVFVAEVPRDRSQARRPAPGRSGESPAKGTERLELVELDADDLGEADLVGDELEADCGSEDDEAQERVTPRARQRPASQPPPQPRPSRGPRRVGRAGDGAAGAAGAAVEPTIQALTGAIDRLVTTVEGQQAQTKVALDLAALNSQAAATAMIESVGQIRKLEAALVQKEQALAVMVQEHQRLASEATLSPGVAAALSLAERALQAYIATATGGNRHGG